MKYIPYVNIKMGTRSVLNFSNGNTLPLTQLPFGMTSFCLQTNAANGAWFFNPDYPLAEGVRLTHQPSPWINDYGTFLMTVQNDNIKDNPLETIGSFSANSVMRPDYLSVKFLRTNCFFELTPTERCGAIRITLYDNRQSFLSFLPTKGNYSYRFDEKTSTLIGTTDGHSMDDCKKFKMYFAVKFLDGCVDSSKNSITSGSNTAFAHIALKKNVCEARIGTSYISEEMALLAVSRECGDMSFDAIRNVAEENWEEKLSRIEIEPTDEKQMKTFYSCLYRTFLFPHKAYEIDKDGNAVHYAPFDGQTHSGVRYTDNGFWDTARTVYPLFTLIARDEFAEMLEGFVNDYKECGYLPRWLSLGEVGCMPSTLIDGVIAEAAVNGIGKREVLESALDGMIHHANNEASDRRYGRNGAEAYLKYGYVPRDMQRESVNLTLDAAYGDWCIATVAKILGRNEICDEYIKRSKNYKNLFDKETGFMRGRDTNGQMADNFDPCSWGGEYTEGSAWQNSFFVPHDVEGLTELYGSKEAFIKKLDELFSTQPIFRTFGYNGYEIHEMSEMAIADFGQCAISNQPSFHIPFLYSVLGQQEKTDYWVERMANEAFSPDVDGYPGDEDNGTTSAWYIFACLGFYRLCPGKDEWIPCKRLVKKAKILGKEI